MSIERKVISALKWASFAKLVVQIVSWAGTLLVVRILTPEDYGLMAKVGVVCTIAGAIGELGLEAAIVRSVDLAEEELRKLCGIALAFGATVTGLVILASPWLAQLFREPRLTWPIAAAALQILIGSFAMVPSARLTRNLAFRALAKVEMIAGIVSISTTLLLALYGAGVWSLVLGTLLGALVRMAALLVTGKWVRPLFSTQGMAEHLKFGLTIVGNRVNYFIVIQSDVLIGSSFLSTRQIGQYSVALQLANLPMTKVMGTINQITLPAVAQQQNDLPRMRQSVLRSIGLIALLAFPSLWGISAVAPELMRVLFGPKWIEAVPALVILPLIGPFRMVFGVLFTTSLALGNRRLEVRNMVLNLILLPSGFYIGAHWGLIGLCCAWLVSTPLAYCYSVPKALGLTGIRGRDLMKAIAAPAFAGMLMYVAVAVTRAVLGSMGDFLELLLLSATGAVVYIGAMALIARHQLVDAVAFVKAFRGKA